VVTRIAPAPRQPGRYSTVRSTALPPVKSAVIGSARAISARGGALLFSSAGIVVTGSRT
jgi:hypothetical protein